MKRILILIFIAAMFCSCKKQSGPEGTYDGTFQTNDRNAQGQMVSTSRAASVDVQKVDNDYISISGDQFVYRTILQKVMCIIKKWKREVIGFYVL